jgi:Tfp pilus assembly protein PilF
MSDNARRYNRADMANRRRDDALIALIAIATHATALRGGFIWLDHAHIEDRLGVAPLRGWTTLFTQGFAGTGYYRPLMALSLSLDAAFGQGAWLYHATTVLWHALAAVLTSTAACALGLSRRAAVAAGILFAVHPLSSLVAGAIAFRSEAMVTGALLALIVLHRKCHPAAGLALLFGALTKETGLVLGALFVVALELTPFPRRPPLRNRVRLWTTEATALGLAIGLRCAFAPPWRASWAPLSFGGALGTRFAALAKSTVRVFFPIDVTVCDSFAVTPLASATALVGFAVAACVVYVAYKCRGPGLLLVLSLLPCMQIVPIMRWWSPHYLYVPFAFVAMLIAGPIVERSARATSLAVVAAVLLAGMSFASDLRFASDVALWTDEVQANPSCREGYFYLAEVAREQRRFDDAARAYERALAVTPGVLSYVDRVAALQNLGVVRLEQGKFPEARIAFRSALGIVRDDGYRRLLLHNLATAELRGGNPEEAARLLEGEVARADALPASIFIRARAVETLGRAQEARDLLRRLPSRMPLDR